MRWQHISCSKEYLRQQIKQVGASTVLENFTGTDDEALAALDAEPHDWFPVGPCDNRGPDGKCLGHDTEPD